MDEGEQQLGTTLFAVGVGFNQLPEHKLSFSRRAIFAALILLPDDL
jgi:hypothetical protein